MFQKFFIRFKSLESQFYYISKYDYDASKNYVPSRAKLCHTIYYHERNLPVTSMTTAH